MSENKQTSIICDEDLTWEQKRQLNDRWVVLCIGGASGTGKSKLAYQLSNYYSVPVIEVDDLCQGIKAMTTYESHPVLHYWESGINWMDVGVEGNVQWLKEMGQVLIPALKGFIDNHLESGVRVILEGDFIHPRLLSGYDANLVKGLFVHEMNHQQVVTNYLRREGGSPQDYRASISVAHSLWLGTECQMGDIPFMPARPWDTVLDRTLAILGEPLPTTSPIVQSQFCPWSYT